ncbi:type II toxin-antitoxin system Phd/YefM family antitoxin [Candidatus Gottesmanbacteria bacterium]|nr:type II toxin-antitoxin system Phd/YefM family antitoxin [Candidatus Gottesmanbacteria bacterium]
MLQIKPQNIIPITAARAKLDDLVTQARGSNMFVISRKGKAEAAVIDVAYLMELEKKLDLAEMRRINEEMQKAFRTYLRKKGKNPDTMTDEEAEAELAKLTS